MVQNNVVRHLQELPQPNATVVSQDHVAVIYRHPRNNQNNNENEPQGNQVIKKPTKILGFIQVGVGVINLLAALVFMSVGAYDEFAYDNYGNYGVAAVYTSIVNIVNGIIGYFSSQNIKNIFLNGCNMFYSILSCISAIVTIFIFGIFLGNLSSCPTSQPVDPKYEDGPVCERKPFAAGISIVLILINSVVMFIALASSIFTCMFYDHCLQCCKGDEEAISLMHIAMGVILVAISLPFLQVGAMDHLAYGDYYEWGISGIIAGIFNAVNGFLGFFSGQNTRNKLLNDCNTFFCIMSCGIAIFNIAVFGLLMGTISTCHTKIPLSYLHKEQVLKLKGLPNSLPPFIDNEPICKQKALAISFLLSLIIVTILELFFTLMSLTFACHFYRINDEFFPFQKNLQYNLIPDEAEAQNIIRDNNPNYGSHQNVSAVERQDLNESRNGAERPRRPYNTTNAVPDGEIAADYIVHNREMTSERQEGPLENPPPYPYVDSQNLPSTSRDFLDQPPSYMDQAKQQ